jgi:hypothetical protein
MTQLSWVESGDAWIETESDAYDYTIDKHGGHYVLRRFIYDGEQLLTAIPCMNLECAKATAQKMEDLVPAQKAKQKSLAKRITDGEVFIVNDGDPSTIRPAPPVAHGFSEPDWRD